MYSHYVVLLGLESVPQKIISSSFVTVMFATGWESWDNGLSFMGAVVTVNV